MKLYTRTGDDGTTGLFGGARVGKDALRVCAYGEIDETNAVLGWCVVVARAPVGGRLEHIQNALFVIGAELASAPQNKAAESFVRIEDGEVARLEAWIDESTADVPALRNFILPGGGEAAARLHVARGVCRRAERSVVHLAEHETVRPVVIRYLNRLSDLLFAWARWMNHAEGCTEVPWKPAKPQT